MTENKMLQFSTFSSLVDPSFWHKLNQIKLDEDRLEEKERNIWGSFSSLDSDGSFCVDVTAFNSNPESNPPQKHAMQGVLINFNTIESFKECDKMEIIKKHGQAVEANWSNDSEPNVALSKFVLISFADLKKYHFYYWFAFIAPKGPTAQITKDLTPITDVFSGEQIARLNYLAQTSGQHFTVKVNNDDSLEVVPFEAYGDLKSSGCKVFLGFVDPSNLADCPGWPLRTLLKVAALKWPELLRDGVKIDVLCLRLSRAEAKTNSNNSVILEVQIKSDAEEVETQWVGWERNERAKLGPRLANLSSSMDPKKLAECAVDLNLKLMKWRLLPQIDLDLIKNSRCLLLGAGTLGCAVARVLMGWGVRKITFLDSGRVSYSNPVRQTLFLHRHCVGAGVPKAKAAAEALFEIFPGMDAEGVQLSIPMPGHSITESQQDEVEKDVQRVDELIANHDAIFLLTDSRESRWLPTMLSKYHNKLVINAALGFDSFLVMRHGVLPENSEVPEASSSTSSPSKEKSIPGHLLGCYFCNDVVAPRNSLSQRSLDQQCTVVRPGVSQIAAALAVELLVSVLQHPLKGAAPASCDPEQSAMESGSPLGLLPHSIRGYLAQFQIILPATRAFPQCAACSPLILSEYKEKGFEFLLQVFNSPGFLEDLTGLSELQKRSDEAEIWALTDSEGEMD
ncbi:ubiquitin-like modifier-activating enzyme ATG7 [Neocloeon triangulifer]|uniref:ubiquitin-like modifier-activating enzyme ATG7 n=1 Tax=Neocloeon triangulifer TaxID=2078957 RepID=UPI00286EE699|nr:ubiquitin-like modifier-activating enzyme ATG7 [Neocloeon triangulifer]XP_059481169.1 ubiquitin-like modifier-activating enzyme ATG7 [Neocloeon triangulifer]XP_059481170.1 ubiquitin-like modifier-activating enzyme ATG7 [Neocloeon triangulifer]